MNRIIHGRLEIWNLASRVDIDIERVSAANEWDIEEKLRISARPYIILYNCSAPHSSNAKIERDNEIKKKEILKSFSLSQFSNFFGANSAAVLFAEYYNLIARLHVAQFCWHSGPV